MSADVPLHPEPEIAPSTRWRWIVGGVLVILAVWMSLAAIRLFQARDLALAGVDRLEGVRQQLSLDDVLDRRLLPGLRAAGVDFAAAHDRVRSPLVAPLRLIPWLGTQVRSADALSSSAKLVTETLTEALVEVADLADSADDRDRLALAVEALSIVDTARETIGTVDLGPPGGLMRSLADARQRFAGELEEANALLADAQAAAAGIADFLEGPYTYLLLAANNSEMGAGSGSYLQVGTVHVINGHLKVSELRPAGDITVERGAVEIPDGDLADRWSWLDIAVDWRNLSPSPRFEANAELAAAMWEALEGEQVDGVIVLDPVALAAILAATGPIDIDGRSIDASDVVRELLFDQYWEDDVGVRRDRLREIAAAALREVDAQDTDSLTLARGLQDSAAARHILAWSPHPIQQQAWQVLGIEGSLAPDSLSVSVLNRGANKLDTFLAVGARLKAESTGRERVVTVTVTLDNQAQPGFPDYVLGPAEALGYDPGTYSGILALNIPGSAREEKLLGVDALIARGPDGVSQVVAVWVEIPAGESLIHELTFELPLEQQELRVEPSARVPGIAWTGAGTDWIDTTQVVVDLANGTVAGDAVDRPLAPVVFEVDPIKNPTAPIPSVTRDGDTETTVLVSWRALGNDPAVDVWERAAGADWILVGTDVTGRSLTLAGRTRGTEFCYRTALHVLPDRFSPVSCLTVPISLGYMRFFGDSDSYFSAPDFVDSGDLDVRVLVAPDRWQPEFWQMFGGQYDTAANDRAWRFGIDIFNALVSNFSGDGLTDLGANRAIPVSFRDGSRQWVRMTVEPAAGRLRFWVSRDGVEWNQLGDDRSFEPTGDLADSTGPVYIGADRRGSDNPFTGKLYYFEVRNGIDGPIIGELDFRTDLQLSGGPDRWVDGRGNVFSAHGAAWEYVPPEE